MLKTNDGRLVVVAGASRTGKTAITAERIKPFSTVFAWDIEDQWSQLRGFKRITKRSELEAAVKSPAGPRKIAFVSNAADIKSDFEFFCTCVYFYGRFRGPCACIAEELADVSNAGKAMAKWGILVRRGLKRGISIFAISQRWAEADKTAVGNASQFVCFRMSSGDDIIYMSRKTRIPRADLESLVTEFYPKSQNVKRSEYISYEVASRRVTKGELRF